jgi:hypothetical protein
MKIFHKKRILLITILFILIISCDIGGEIVAVTEASLKESHIDIEEGRSEKYHFLGWAHDHFHHTKNGLISDRDYPLTWEPEASQAEYEGMRIISSGYVDKQIAASHTWHSTELFLYLYNLYQKRNTL